MEQKNWVMFMISLCRSKLISIPLQNGNENWNEVGNAFSPRYKLYTMIVLN